MKSVNVLIVSAALCVSALAGPAASPSGKSVQPYPAQTDNCWAPGFTMGAFAGGLFPSHRDSGVAGGGILGEYFWSENFGVQGSYGLYATNSAHHQIDGSFIARAPMGNIAPYLMAGGGLGMNGSNHGDFHAGGGLEARIPSMNCMGLFIDGNYHFTSTDQADFTLVRIGMKIRF